MSKSEDYENLVFEVIPPKRWRLILESLAKKAEEGDLAAIRALMPYFKPKPSGGQLRFELLEDL